MATGPPWIDRTIIFCDCKESIGSIASDEVFNIMKHGPKRGQDVLSPISIQKTVLSLCVQGITDYCRIALDLFSEEMQIVVYSVHKRIVCHNYWNFQEQTLQKITEGFDGIEPSQTTRFEDGLRDAVNFLTDADNSTPYEASPQANRRVSKKNRTRIICLLPQSRTSLQNYLNFNYSDENSKDICELVQTYITEVNSSLSNREQPIEHCDLTLLKLVDDNVKLNDSNSRILPRKISPFLTCSVHLVENSRISEAIVDLARLQFDLRQVIISGIPMKEKDSTDPATRSMYDVELFYPSASVTAASLDYLSQAPILTEDHPRLGHCMESEKFLQDREVFLRWKSIDRKTNAMTLACKSIHRVSPLTPSSSPTVCLARHVLSGKPVTLITVPHDKELPSGAIPSSSPYPVSHLIISQGESIFLHILRPNPFSLHDIPAMVAAYSNASSQTLRTKDFAHLFDLNLIRTPKSNTRKNAKPSLPLTMMPIDNGVTTPKIERLTRFYPLLDNDTLLFSQDAAQDLKSLLDPIKEKCLQDTLHQDEVETCIALAARFHQFCMLNEIRLFPNFNDKPKARQESYQRLWKELYLYVKQFTDLSLSHAQITAALERMWPEMCKEAERIGIAIKVKSEGPSVPESNAPINSTLYSNLMNAKSAESDDVWNQVEQARKISEEEKWKKVDASQRPVEEMMESKRSKEEIGQPERKKLKKAMIDQNLETCDKQTLFYQYWSATQNKKRPIEFHGRHDMD